MEQRIELEGLCDEIGGAVLDRVHGVLHRAVAGDHDRDYVGVPLEGRIEHVAAVDAWQAQVGDENVEGEVGEPFERLFAGACLLYRIPVIRQAFSDSRPQRRLVIDDEQMFPDISHLPARAVL